VVHGLSHEGYRSILLRHVFGGDCLQGPFNNDRTACRYFAHNFNSPTEMTKTAFDIISSATSKERSTDELLSLFHTLDLLHVFKPRNLRDQILRAFKTQSVKYVSPLTITPGEEFHAFKKHDKSTLLSIASSHQILTDTFTSTKDSLRTAILTHFIQGKCCENINNDSASACVKTTDRIFGNKDFENSSDLHVIRDRFLHDWLMSQYTKLCQKSVVRLLKVLDIEFDPQQALSTLRSHLKKFC
jgi:hypothetical protein